MTTDVIERLPARVDATALVESVIVKGDLSKLTPHERTHYYMQVCESVGLNPLTRPLEYIVLNGKLTLYARRDAADQLRKLRGVSVEIVAKSISDGLMQVHVRAKDRDGRMDEDLGVVNIAGLKGEAQANAILKCVTKAKRRVTLSICGLGFLDETEIEDIPTAKPANGQGNGEPISAEQKQELIALQEETGADTKKFLAYLNVGSLDELPAVRFAEAKAALEKKRSAK